jgi:hypothetical protein
MIIIIIITMVMINAEGPGPAMNADKRGEMLGEKPLPAPHMARTEHTGSVFDLVSTADKERLTGLKNRFEKSETFASAPLALALALFPPDLSRVR